jgi:hypothetical protein
MSRLFFRLLLALPVLFFVSCNVIDDASGMIHTYIAPSKPALTNIEVISGLKEALNVGIKNAVNLTSITDGFLQNSEIRLQFPQDALKVKEKALELGMTSQVEKFETTMNHAAEEATKEALSIFEDAISNMSISDGFAILNGGNGAATKYLKDHTSSKLVTSFSPKVESAISRVKLTEYWYPIITKYNSVVKLTGGEQINPDLNKYVTEKAILGLFHMVEIEENKIRKDPVARITENLEKVFGSITGN